MKSTLVGLILLSWTAVADSGITYHGRLISPSGAAVSASSVQFRMELRSPGAEDCLLYQETQTHDLSTTNGLFAITLGDGSVVREDSNSWDLLEAFSNRMTYTGMTCASGTTYTPSARDARHFKISFNDGSFAGFEELPPQVVNYIPMAAESLAVGGFTPTSLVRVEDAGTLGSIAPLTSPQYAEILSLVAGTSTLYTQANELNGSPLPAIGAGESVRWDGSAWQAYSAPVVPTCGAGEVVTGNGTVLSCVVDAGGSGGTVTSVSGTAPIVVGGTATDPLISIADTGTAGTYGSSTQYPVITTDAKGRVSNVTLQTVNNSPVGSTLAQGQTFMGDGSNEVASRFIYTSDIRSSIAPFNPVFPANCGADDTLTWSAITDVFTCTAIAIDASQVANLPSAQWGEGSGNVYRATGFVGVGTNNPTSALHVQRDVAGTSTVLNLSNQETANWGVGSELKFTGDGARDMAIFSSQWAGGTNSVITAIESRYNNSMQTMIKFQDGAVHFGNDPFGAVPGSGRINVQTGTNGGNYISDALTLVHADGDSAASSGIGNRIGFATETSVQGSNAQTSYIESVLDDANDISRDGSLRFGTLGPNAGSGDSFATEKMRITSSGFVGIGTNNPTGPLHVDGGAAPVSTNGALITIKGQNATGPASGGGGGIHLETGTGAGGWADGNFDLELRNGVASIHRGEGSTYSSSSVSGNNPGYVLSLNNGYFVDGSTAILALKPRNSAGNQFSYFGAVSSPAPSFSPNLVWGQQTGANAYQERMRIDADGDLGVGTDNPSEKLHVFGNLRVQGSTDCTLGDGAGGTNCSSDERLKTDVYEIENPLDKILSLRGVEFTWNALSQSAGRKDIGVIAQDVEKVFPTAVVSDRKTGYKKVDYAVLVAPLIEAIKELFHSTDERISKLEQENMMLKDWICKKDASASFCVSK